MNGRWRQSAGLPGQVAGAGAGANANSHTMGMARQDQLLPVVVAIEPTGGSYTATRLCVLAAAAHSTIVARETLTVGSRFWLPSSPRSMNMKPFAFIALCQVCQVNSRVAMGGPCCWSAADELQDSKIATTRYSEVGPREFVGRRSVRRQACERSAMTPSACACPYVGLE